MPQISACPPADERYVGYRNLRRGTLRSLAEAVSADDYRSGQRRVLPSRIGKTYDAAKGWVARAGGAWTPEAWLVYAASGVFHRQPRIGVRSIDLALGNWVKAPPDRSILLWARASITWRRLADPRTAELDFTSAAPQAPAWLRARLEQDRVSCREAAAVSRKRRRRSQRPRSTPTSAPLTTRSPHPFRGTNLARSRPCARFSYRPSLTTDPRLPSDKGLAREIRRVPATV